MQRPGKPASVASRRNSCERYRTAFVATNRRLPQRRKREAAGTSSRSAVAKSRLATLISGSGRRDSNGIFFRVGALKAGSRGCPGR